MHSPCPLVHFAGHPIDRSPGCVPGLMRNVHNCSGSTVADLTAQGTRVCDLQKKLFCHAGNASDHCPKNENTRQHWCPMLLVHFSELTYPAAAMHEMKMMRADRRYPLAGPMSGCLISCIAAAGWVRSENGQWITAPCLRVPQAGHSAVQPMHQMVVNRTSERNIAISGFQKLPVLPCRRCIR